MRPASAGPTGEGSTGRPASPPRYASLDALRGIAALTVVLYHCAKALPGLEERSAGTAASVLLALGPSAVLVFFALSGFVLYLTFDTRDRFAYRPYVIKRIARIYPPLVAAILASAFLYRMIGPRPVPDLSDWFNTRSWQDPPTLAVVLGHMALLDRSAFHGLNNVVWSLVAEVRISLIFPLIALAVRANWWMACLGGLAVTLLARRYYMLTYGWLVDPLSTIQYVVLFVAGAALADRRAVVRRLGERAAASGVGGLLFVGLLLGSLILLAQGLTTSMVATSLGATTLVALCFAHPPTGRVLALRPLAWLGRVSYSLYLLHLLVMLALVHGLRGYADATVLVALVAPVSLLLAEPAYRLVEHPSIALGRRLAATLGPRPAEVDRTAAGSRPEPSPGVAVP